MLMIIASDPAPSTAKGKPDDGRTGKPSTESKQLNVAVRPDLKAWLVQHCRANDIRMTDFINDLLQSARSASR